jgi:hypothetical protein
VGFWLVKRTEIHAKSKGNHTSARAEQKMGNLPRTYKLIWIVEQTGAGDGTPSWNNMPIKEGPLVIPTPTTKDTSNAEIILTIRVKGFMFNHCDVWISKGTGTFSSAPP